MFLPFPRIDLALVSQITGSMKFHRFYIYLGVSLYAVREQEPGVKLHVITIVFSPSQEEFSAMILACKEMSCKNQRSSLKQGFVHVIRLQEKKKTNT